MDGLRMPGCHSIDVPLEVHFRTNRNHNEWRLRVAVNSVWGCYEAN
jgi:hypothetical protein